MQRDNLWLFMLELGREREKKLVSVHHTNGKIHFTKYSKLVSSLLKKGNKFTRNAKIAILYFSVIRVNFPNYITFSHGHNKSLFFFFSKRKQFLFPAWNFLFLEIKLAILKEAGRRESYIGIQLNNLNFLLLVDYFLLISLLFLEPQIYNYT